MLVINGAVPFLALPTLAQAVWSTGFSLSFIQNSLLSIYATNFGNPEPAAIAFGLAGAYPAGILISLGLHPSDAYSFMVAIWLTVAFWGALKIGRFLGLPISLASICALLWTSMPIIWNHAGYSMLSLGIALLTFYFYTAINLIFKIINKEKFLISIIGYFIAAIIAVFMDGYSFMMFAVGASILGVYVLICYKESRLRLIKYALPIHVASFALAYGLYVAYVGRTGYKPDHLDIFRGYGLDLSFIAIPTKGVLWLWDALGLSVFRSESQFFGDASVWITTFALPLILVGITAWILMRKKNKLATCFLILALFGYYMSLGPSLKLDSVKTDVSQGASMPAELAVAPTGSAVLSEYIPGFSNMRAAYRWSALGMLGFWLLIVLLLACDNSKSNNRNRNIVFLIICFLIINNLPDIPNKWHGYKNNRNMFLALNTDLVNPLSKDLSPGERVAFLPYRNDFLVNYLAPELKIETFNIGGDKNLDQAVKNWPLLMKEFKQGHIDVAFSPRIANLLVEGEVDAVVLPYIDMLWAAHNWPAENLYKDELKSIINEIENYELFQVEHENQYVVIKLKPVYKNQIGSKELLNKLGINGVMPPKGLRIVSFSDNFGCLQVGRIKNGAIYTNGQEGFLCFGPYVPLNAGRYHLTVKGKASLIENAWVDIASNQGKQQYAKILFSNTGDNEDHVLISEFITLDKPVDDLEIRVYVSASEKMRLDGYELVEIKNDI